MTVPLNLSFEDYKAIERGLYPISKWDIIEAVKKGIIITVKKDGISYTVAVDDKNNLFLNIEHGI